MQTGLPLPYFESEGLEDGNRQYHESGTDSPRRYRFYMSLFHICRKGW
jgi:hypothetical protein